MSAERVEAFLARLYVDAEVRRRFKENPFTEAGQAGLSEEECHALENIDRNGLEMAAQSFAKKREYQREKLRTSAARNWLRRGWRLFKRTIAKPLTL